MWLLDYAERNGLPVNRTLTLAVHALRDSPEAVLEAVLEAFREATGWSDEDALHYAQCDRCTPICGAEEEDCPDAPAATRLKAHIAATPQDRAAVPPEA